jgi:acetyl esterase/lipase
MKRFSFSSLPRYLCLLATLGLAACTEAGFAVANLPSHFEDITVVHDIAYGVEPEEGLDLYTPKDATQMPRDVAVFFYGGRWENGDKEDYRFVAATFADKGFIAVIPDYRKYPQVRFPVFVQDGAAALAWVYRNIDQYGGDPARIHVIGHSAGAHIGALLTADARYLQREGLDRSAVIHDFSGLAGPYDFTPKDPDLKDMFGPPDHYAQMQAPNFIDGHEPPMLLLYGDADKYVERYNLERLQTRIQQKGGCVKSIIYSLASHNDLVAALSWVNPAHIPVLDDVTAYWEEDRQQQCL